MVDLIKTVISAGIGVADIVAGEYGGKIGPLDAEDVFRFSIAGGSLVASLLNIEGRRPGEEGYADLAFYVSLPLVEKSVYKLVKAGKGTTAGATATTTTTTAKLPAFRVVTTGKVDIDKEKKEEKEIVAF